MSNVSTIKDNCCGCQACEQICPVSAIKFECNNEGFLYPQIGEKCIECGLCITKCPVISPPKYNTPRVGYAAYIKDSKSIQKSASGGIFYALAQHIISKGGIVYGCAELEVGFPKHIGVKSIEELSYLQGSKYAESNITDVLPEIVINSNSGKIILFTGTPCQNAALRNIIGDQDNIYYVDVICHGVPSQKMYRAYLKWEEERTRKKISKFVFRSKKQHGWSLTYRMELQKGKRKYTIEKIASLSPYYHHFLCGLNYRESCYRCKFARGERVTDITLGDFWGINNINWKLYNYDGVSTVLVNTERGERLWKQISAEVNSNPIEIDLIRQYNGQLRMPSNRPQGRDTIYKELTLRGFDSIAKKYRNKKEICIDTIRNIIPNRYRQVLKRKIMYREAKLKE